MEQMVFAFPNKISYNQKDFIITSSNKDAASAINDYPKNWGVLPFQRTLLIYGPTKCGKSFLSHIWATKAKAYKISNIESFQPPIRYKAYLIEDIQHYIKQPETLLHIFNIINEEKASLLLTSNQLLNSELEDLNSRIKSIRTIKISPPDNEMIKVILYKECLSRQLKLPREIVEYLSYLLPRNFRLISDIVSVISQSLLSRKGKVTKKFIESLLKEKGYI